MAPSSVIARKDDSRRPRSAALAVLRRLRARRSVILAYHGVAPSHASVDPHFLRVAPDRFRGQVELLRDAGFEFVTVAELADRRGNGDGPPPPGLVALSFDDGLQDNHAVLLPILKEHGIPATVYVMTGYIGKPYPWIEQSDVRLMNEDELRELAAAGVELGAHTVSHPDMSELGREECLREMVESRDEVTRIAAEPVRTFAYPFCRYGDAAVAAAAEAGFDAAVTCHGRGDWSPHTMQRAMITGKDGTASFVLKMAGAYQPLFDSPPGRLFRASTRAARSALRRRRG